MPKRNTQGIVAYTFFNVCEKMHLFLSSIKKDADKRKVVPFFCLTVYIRNGRVTDDVCCDIKKEV